MKTILIATIIIGCLAACSSPTKITSSWRDPDERSKPHFNKIVVAALLQNQNMRRQAEDYMISIYPGRASQSYLIFGDSLVTDANGESQKLRDMGFDGMIIMKQVGKDTNQYYVPGVMPEYYNTWGGYWGYGWGGRWGLGYYPGATPGYVQTDKTWYVQVNAYSLVKNKLVWSVTTATTNPGGRIPLYVDVCKAVRSKMEAAGIFR